MTPDTYDAWYATPRGRWIGDREFSLLARLLDTRPGETLLDVGCGTGYFSCLFARKSGLKVTGVDIDAGMLAFARDKSPDIEFVLGDAENLPFRDASFDVVVAVTSLCFVSDTTRAVCEMARVAGRRIGLGLLGRHSLLWLTKRTADSYAGAHWHTEREALDLLAQSGLQSLRCGHSVYLHGGDRIARLVESILPVTLPCGGFLAVTGAPWRTAQGNS